jgi:hypothetical protein
MGLVLYVAPDFYLSIPTVTYMLAYCISIPVIMRGCNIPYNVEWSICQAWRGQILRLGEVCNKNP